MSETDRAVELTAALLKQSEGLPWKTASYLSDKLAAKDCHIEPEALEEALLDRAGSPDRQIRYSFFPARKTLDLLWGHVGNVEDFDSLPSPHLEPSREFLEAAGDFKPCTVSVDATWCFLSHSFRDIDNVSKLRSELLGLGYGVWLAEAEIFLGDMITKRVQEGLEQADRLVVYMTRRSLGSRWVLKELSVAIKDWRLPPTIVVDGNDEDLCEMFLPWLEAEWDIRWLEDTMDRLLVEVNEERASTRLEELLIGALQNVPRQQRHVVQYPEPAVGRMATSSTLAEVLSTGPDDAP